MTRRFAVVYEAEADFQTATDLADRILLNAIDWLEKDTLSYQRAWIGLNNDGHPFAWKAIKGLSRKTGIRLHHGHFQGVPGLPDAAAARRAIGYLLHIQPHLDAILLIRDQDGDQARREGLEQARREHEGDAAIVIGLAVVERESWVICGFDPSTDRESERLEEIRQELGFDPRHRSSELTASKDDRAKRSSKRVLRLLSEGDPYRESRCWCETALATLQERGTTNGLADFLGEVRGRLAPLIEDQR